MNHVPQPAKSPFSRSPVRGVIDALCFPLRAVVLSERWSEKCGLRSLAQERMAAVWPHLRGRVLDIGAGENRLMRLYGNGVGVDVHDAGGGATIVEDTTKLPFENGSFDTVCFLACLNHIPKREAVLQEAYRVLRPGGRCVITMIEPWIGFMTHRFCWYDESHHRHVDSEEKDGLWPEEVKRLISETGFELEAVFPFLYHLNRVYVASKKK